VTWYDYIFPRQDDGYHFSKGTVMELCNIHYSLTKFLPDENLCK